MSFRLKIILGTAAIQAVLLLILIVSSMNFLHQSNQDALQKRAQTTARLFSAATQDAVLATDLAALESTVSAVMANPGIVYARVSGNGRTLAQAGDAQALARPFRADTAIEEIDDDVFDVGAEIRIQDVPYGRVEIGLSVDAIKATLHEAKTKAMAIAAAGMLLVALFSYVLGLYLTRNLDALREGARHLASGELGYQIGVHGSDELARTARTFNDMSQNLRTASEERRRAEYALLESRRLIQSILDYSSAVIFVKDIEGRYLLINRRYETLFHVGNDSIRGKTDHDLFPREQADQLHAADQKALSDGMAVEFEELVPQDDGLHTYISVKCPLYDETGKAYAVCGIATDITERKRAEAELTHYKEHLEHLVSQRTGELTRANEELTTTNRKLEEAHNQLLQSEKMASIGQLAAGVAHEINNPIGFVISNMGSLEQYLRDLMRVISAYEASEDQLASQAGCPDSIRAVKEAVDLGYLRRDAFSLLAESNDGLLRVKKIVQDLKDFSHVGESEWQIADLHHGLDSTLNIVRNELRYKAEVVKNYGSLPEVECLPLELNQVFMNLLVNAGQAIVEHGQITIGTGVEGDGVWVEIADTGAGITPEILNRIFDPFFTTKPVGQGTGLGLSLSYSIVQKHHGRIEVASTPGQGTRFRICLPVRQPGDLPSTGVPA